MACARAQLLLPSTSSVTARGRLDVRGLRHAVPPAHRRTRSCSAHELILRSVVQAGKVSIELRRPCAAPPRSPADRLGAFLCGPPSAVFSGSVPGGRPWRGGEWSLSSCSRRVRREGGPLAAFSASSRVPSVGGRGCRGRARQEREWAAGASMRTTAWFAGLALEGEHVDSAPGRGHLAPLGRLRRHGAPARVPVAARRSSRVRRPRDISQSSRARRERPTWARAGSMH